MAYGGFEYLAKRTASDKGLRDKALNIAKNPASMLYTFLDKNLKGSSVTNNEINKNLLLVKELHKPIIRTV